MNQREQHPGEPSPKMTLEQRRDQAAAHFAAGAISIDSLACIERELEAQLADEPHPPQSEPRVIVGFSRDVAPSRIRLDVRQALQAAGQTTAAEVFMAATSAHSGDVSAVLREASRWVALEERRPTDDGKARLFVHRLPAASAVTRESSASVAPTRNRPVRPGLLVALAGVSVAVIAAIAGGFLRLPDESAATQGDAKGQLEACRTLRGFTTGGYPTSSIEGAQALILDVARGLRATGSSTLADELDWEVVPLFADGTGGLSGDTALRRFILDHC